MASILKVDELQGITAAGDITVTSEGGAATQSLQQGLAKAWNNTNSTGTTINNSFGISSLVDTAIGVQTHNVINSFSDANTVPTFTVDNNENQQWTSGLTTSAWDTRNYTGAGYVDAGMRTVCQGDLA